MSLAGQTAFVTGGSRGIGRAICIALAEQGARVAFCHADDPQAV
jgi:3-oxoacyl-[acyl-carrier protein] reductase